MPLLRQENCPSEVTCQAADNTLDGLRLVHKLAACLSKVVIAAAPRLLAVGRPRHAARGLHDVEPQPVHRRQWCGLRELQRILLRSHAAALCHRSSDLAYQLAGMSGVRRHGRWCSAARVGFVPAAGRPASIILATRRRVHEEHRCRRACLAGTCDQPFQYATAGPAFQAYISSARRRRRTQQATFESPAFRAGAT